MSWRRGYSQGPSPKTGASLSSQRCPISEPPKLTIPKSPCRLTRCIVLKALALKSACLGSNPTSHLPDWFLGKFLDLSKPHFSHLWNGNNHSVHLQCHNEQRAHDKHSVNVGYCYCHLILTCILAFSFFISSLASYHMKFPLLCFDTLCPVHQLESWFNFI